MSITHLLLIPNPRLIIYITLDNLPHLLLRIRLSHHHTSINLQRRTFLRRFIERRSSENDRAGFDAGLDGFEVLAVKIPLNSGHNEVVTRVYARSDLHPLV